MIFFKKELYFSFFPKPENPGKKRMAFTGNLQAVF